jgi:glycosyltransferase involved in cell wall biosynthesis
MKDQSERFKSMPEKPLVTITAICHNHAPYVIETLESIRNQTYKNIELIIINNLKDNCRQIIEDWITTNGIKCRFIQNEQPLTISQNFNLALSFTNGKYFQTISCDDILMTSKIEKQVNFFEALDNNYAVVYGDELRINEYGDRIGEETLFQERLRKYNLATLAKGNLISFFSEVAFLSAPSLLYKTEILRKMNGFDEDFFIEDWPLFLKLSKHGYYFDYIDEVVVKYRILSSSLSHSRNWHYHLEHLRIYYKYKDVLIKNSRTSFKIRFYLIDVGRHSFKYFIQYYFRLFTLIPKDARSHLKYLNALFKLK